MSALRIFTVLLISAATSLAADYPAPAEGDYVIENFKFTSGETLPELRIHYRTIGKPETDAHGVIDEWYGGFTSRAARCVDIHPCSVAVRKPGACSGRGPSWTPLRDAGRRVAA